VGVTPDKMCIPSAYALAQKKDPCLDMAMQTLQESSASLPLLRANETRLQLSSRSRVDIVVLRRLPPEVLGVALCERVPLLRQIIKREDSGNRAYRNAGAAVDALYRIDIQQLFGCVGGLVFLGMNAIDRARIHTRGVFGADARLSNNIGHKGVNLLRVLRLFYYRSG
jgi:hypothetical protein